MPSSMYLQEGGFSQRNQRRTGTIFRDQHGRRYHAVIELKSGHPTGLIEPLFQAPLMPPQKYLRVGTNPEKPYDLEINYTEWLADLRTAHAEYLDEARKLARAIYRDRYNPDDALTEEVVRVVGPKPQHVEPVLAARQGNRYVLGLTDRVDIRLSAMLEEDRPHFANQTPLEPDFSDVVESLDDDSLDESFADVEAEAERKREEVRARDRARKARQRAAQHADAV